MDSVTQILKQLGVNSTVWGQLVLFLVSYFFLSQFFFKPYRRNLDYRKKNTVGNTDETTKLTNQVDALAQTYQAKLKALNDKGQAAYNQLKAEGAAEEERIISQARQSANQLIDKTRKKIATDVAVARENLKSDIPVFSKLLASRVLGREL